MGKKIFLYGYYGFGNLGDDLLLKSVIEGISHHWPDAHFTLRNYSSISFLKDYDGKVTQTDCDALLEGRKRNRCMKLITYLRSIYTAIKGHDVMVFGGGTLWHTNPSINSLLIVFLVMLCARLRGLKIVAVGLGVGPCKGIFAQYLLRLMVRLCEDICVRDRQSLSNLPKADNCRLTADLLYGSSIAEQLQATSPSSSQASTIAISTAFSQSEEQADALIQQIVETTSPFLEKGWKIKLMIFLDNNVISDVPFMEKLKSSFAKKHDHKISLLKMTADVNDMIKAFHDIKIHIGMRFHGAVIASLLHIPFIGVSNDHKVHELANYFTLPSYPPGEVETVLNPDMIKDATEYTYSQDKLDALMTLSSQNYLWFSK
jgi:polysaccharide pyruvyl transferase WcaK-like protein